MGRPYRLVESRLESRELSCGGIRVVVEGPGLRSKRSPMGVLLVALRTHALAAAVQSGKQGILKSHRAQIQEATARVIDSLDFDEAMRKSAPSAARWDYFIGTDSSVDAIIGAEVHTVNAHGVTDLVNKKRWSRD